MVDKVTSVDGTVLACHRSGDGPPAILVSGAFNAAQAMIPLARALAPRMTAIAFDRRGRGASGDTPPYAVAREIEDLAALIAAVGGEACLYGHSSGAILAFEAAAAGLPVSRLVMFEPPYRLPAGPQLPPGYHERMAALVSAGQHGEAVSYFMIHAVGLPAAAVSQLRRGPQWAAMEALAPSAVYDGLVVGDASVPAARLAALTVPTLTLDSQGSAPWLRATAAAVADIVPGHHHRSLDGTFHQVPPDALAPVLAGFFLS